MRLSPHVNACMRLPSPAAIAAATSAAVVVNLNGRDIYRSAVLHCDSTRPSDCLQGVWNERIEIQVGPLAAAIATAVAAAAAFLAAAALSAAVFAYFPVAALPAAAADGLAAAAAAVCLRFVLCETLR